VPAVLITGAARRVGRAIALELARAGWAVAVHHNASAEDAATLGAEIAAAGSKAVALQADLADGDAAERLVDEAREALGPLAALVNNASLFGRDDPGSVTRAGWDAHMAVNLRAPALLCRDFAAQLPDGDAGCIVNLLDQKLLNLNPDFYAYTVSKYGLLGLTQTLALAYAPRIRVCGVAPGLVLPSENMTDATFARLHGATPLGYGATPADVAAAVRFVLETPSLTGQVLTVDAGESLAWRRHDVLFDLGEAGDGA
jgi:NAD(P)-dependent dehydrogenase (short-subunit alcohol dehydrogenase family)